MPCFSLPSARQVAKRVFLFSFVGDGRHACLSYIHHSLTCVTAPFSVTSGALKQVSSLLPRTVDSKYLSTEPYLLFSFFFYFFKKSIVDLMLCPVSVIGKIIPIIFL